MRVRFPSAASAIRGLHRPPLPPSAASPEPPFLASRAALPPLLARHLARLVGEARRRPRAAPVVACAVQRDRRAVERAAQRRGQQRDQPCMLGDRAQPLQRHRARGASAHARRVLAPAPPCRSAPPPPPSRSRPRAASARASSRVSASTVARAAPECAIPGIPWCGDSVTFTTVPAPARANASSYAASDMFSMPSTFSRHTARQPFAAISSAGLKNWPPALLTSTSSRPWRSSTVRTSRCASAGSRTSPATQSAPPTAGPMAPGAARSRSGSRDRARADELADLRRRLLEHLAAAPRDRHACPAARQLERARLPQARAAPSHQRHPAAQHPRGERPPTAPASLVHGERS